MSLLFAEQRLEFDFYELEMEIKQDNNVKTEPKLVRPKPSGIGHLRAGIISSVEVIQWFSEEFADWVIYGAATPRFYRSQVSQGIIPEDLNILIASDHYAASANHGTSLYRELAEARHKMITCLLVFEPGTTAEIVEHVDKIAFSQGLPEGKVYIVRPEFTHEDILAATLDWVKRNPNA